jgi:CHAT domain
MGRHIAACVPAEVRRGLDELVTAATAERRLELAVELALAASPRTTSADALPWELLTLDDSDTPIALHPHVDMYRQAYVSTEDAAVSVPVLIAAAVAEPIDSEEAADLDSDRELALLVSAVSVPNTRAEVVRVMANTFGLKASLADDDVHILHVSGHGRPGTLALESWTGEGETVGPSTLREAAEGLAGCKVVVLSACFSATVARSADDLATTGDASVALTLLHAGAASVVAMREAVTTRFADQLSFGIYRRIANGTDCFIKAFGDARRELASSDHSLDGDASGLVAEWSVPVLYVSQRVAYITDDEHARALRRRRGRPPVAAPFAELEDAARHVSRPFAERQVRNFLLNGSGDSVLVIYGPARQGKGTLVLNAALTLGWRISHLTAMAGRRTVDDFLSYCAAALDGPEQGTETGVAEETAALASYLVNRGQPWRARLRELLAFTSKPGMRFVFVWDMFEDLLTVPHDRQLGTSPIHDLQDAEIAELLQALSAKPSGGFKMLIASRFAFRITGKSEQGGIHFRNLGSMSRTRTARVLERHGVGGVFFQEALRMYWESVGGTPGGAPLLAQCLTELAQQANVAPAGDVPVACVRRTVEALTTEARLSDVLASLDPLEVRGSILASVFREPVPMYHLVRLTALDNDYHDTDEERLVVEAWDRAVEGSGDAVIDWNAVDDVAPVSLDRVLQRDPWLRLSPFGANELFWTLIAAGLLTIESETRKDHEAGWPLLMPRWIAHEIAARFPEQVKRAHRLAMEYWGTYGIPSTAR